MEKFSKVGLTLGKFAPFHRGHQYLIECALKEVDSLIVVIYNSVQTTSIPLDVRANWIRRLYPQVEVLEAWDGPTETGEAPEIKHLQEEYIIRLLKGRRVTHFYSSEFYGEHMSKALNAIDRRIDEKRKIIPVSGTQIRQNPYQSRSFLSPIVYRDLVTHVVFLGAPSTGKTTLASALAKEYQTLWMPEYGREYWEKHQVNRRLTLKQLLEIALIHRQKEDDLLLEANRFLFTDTNAITTYLFSLYYHNQADPKLGELANQATKRYHHVFVCDIDIPYEETWDRSGDINRQLFQKKIVEDLKERGVMYHLLSGSLQARMAKVKDVLKQSNTS